MRLSDAVNLTSVKAYEPQLYFQGGGCSWLMKGSNPEKKKPISVMCNLKYLVEASQGRGSPSPIAVVVT